MRRAAPTLIVLAVLAASAAAFAVSERLKLEPAPIDRTRILNKGLFSPVCGCETSEVHLRFRLRRNDRLTVSVLDMDRRLVRKLASGERFERGTVELDWNGTIEAGQRQPDGTYRLRVELRTHGRTINLPNLVRIDTVAPQVTATNPPTPATISPDGDHHSDFAKVAYHLNGHAHGLLYLDGKLVVQGRFQRLRDRLQWYGVVGGRPLRAGRHRLSVGARDAAGNLAAPRPAGTVEIRYIALQPHVLVVRAGHAMRLHVSTDARAYRWHLGARHGFGHGATLSLRAPLNPGKHVLYVEERGHAARTVVIVAP